MVTTMNNNAHSDYSSQTVKNFTDIGTSVGYLQRAGFDYPAEEGRKNKTGTIYAIVKQKHPGVTLQDVNDVCNGKNPVCISKETQAIKAIKECYEFIVKCASSNKPFPNIVSSLSHELEQEKNPYSNCNSLLYESQEKNRQEILENIIEDKAIHSYEKAFLVFWENTSGERDVKKFNEVWIFVCFYILFKEDRFLASAPLETLVEVIYENVPKDYKTYLALCIQELKEIVIPITNRLFEEAKKNHQAKSSERQKEKIKRLLTAMETETLSARGLMGKMGQNSLQSFKRDYLKPALSEEVIEMTLKDQISSPDQKYIMTSKGEDFLSDERND